MWLRRDVPQPGSALVMRLVRRFRRPHPLVLAIISTIGAATLVFYLQYRATTALQSQTQVIVRQYRSRPPPISPPICAARSTARSSTRSPAVNHPDLRAGRLDLVARKFAEGLEAYPHVDRFFAWSAQTETATLARCCSTAATAASVAIPHWAGRVDLARAPRPGAADLRGGRGCGPGEAPQVFLRLFWTDARRLEYFAVLGFVIDPATMPQRLFAEPHGAGLDALLARRAGEMPLQLRVTDERGARRLRQRQRRTSVSGRVPFSMLFYPADDIRVADARAASSRGHGRSRSARRRIGGALGVGSQGYWPDAAVGAADARRART